MKGYQSSAVALLVMAVVLILSFSIAKFVKPEQPTHAPEDLRFEVVSSEIVENDRWMYSHVRVLKDSVTGICYALYVTGESGSGPTTLGEVPCE